MPATSPEPAIDVRAVRRVYQAKPKDITALDGVDLQVAPGEFFGLLGPNGAGKTTLIKILTTLLLPSSGTARVFGFDVVRETKQIRRIMNMVAGGEQSGYGILTVREQLWMFSQFYGLTSRDGWRRVDELIEAVGLDEQRGQRVSTLSTGQRQKMNMARGVLNDPWILEDELTDGAGRRHVEPEGRLVEEEYPAGTPPPEVEALILVVMTVVFAVAARWTLRTLERRARQAGRLSIRWQ